MFIIDQDNNITYFPGFGRGNITAEDMSQIPDGALAFDTPKQLSDILHHSPGSRAVAIWNQLPGVVPIQTPKFRNRSTAVERIWKKLTELFPETAGRVTTEDVPKKTKPTRKPKAEAKTKGKRGIARHRLQENSPRKPRESAWATQLHEQLAKTMKPGQEFGLAEVYAMVPHFRKLHRENHHLEARLRTTLSQDLCGSGKVKWLGKGKYRLVR